jgi:XTP/dITP diphosphohydrolase
MTTLIIATRNTHKVEEIRGILARQFQIQTLRDFPNAPAVIEDADTFAGNATKKAVELARFFSIFKAQPAPSSAFVLADDSGLEVDALNGAPGVHSARFAAINAPAAGNSSDGDNNAKLLRLLKDIPVEKRTARFRCVIALTPLLAPARHGSSPVCDADEHELATELFNGTCEGRIAFAPSGAKGFGYDPLFVPNGFQQSFAELGEDVKNQISHRAQALGKLRDKLARRQD